ncbi:iron-containing alcohol dehydrogenase [Halalkalibacter alkalisediminis]|uniref:Iron-containing alcohol dehydrogenase n=1 Tax=Halalkalibacter alkalisediminis TaxID=935616 RepID=A0ABV6NNB1_9BACI|nr:iron-containing alcohol dehydrogenase [Halalkalibacter alkalisediminis]
MYKAYCRLYQQAFRVTSLFLPWREPEVIKGEGSLGTLPELIRSKKIQSVLIVTDKGIVTLGLLDLLLKGLEANRIAYVIYDQTVPNPTIDNIEEALELFHLNECQGIIAFGGGSPMDCAKGVGARVARPKKTIAQMKGELKVRKEIPLLIAVPTTSGTGSEATVAAVISNRKTKEKFVIVDPVLIPHIAVLDPLLTVNLPKHITATTGMDALTHAIEAYIGRSNTKETRQYCREAIKLIFENLYTAYSDGTNIHARTNMQQASYLAGVAFTRAYVGNIHAIAHTLGGYYSVPHGLANAVIMPFVLKYYGKSVHLSLAELADLVGISESHETAEEKANKFIHAIEKLNEDMEIPTKVSGILEHDIPVLAERALKEANPLYPVPMILTREEMVHLYHVIKE